MGAYISSDDLPFIMHIDDVDVDKIRRAVRELLAKGEVLSVEVPPEVPADADNNALALANGILINMGAVRVVLVTEDAPDSDRPIVPLDWVFNEDE